MSKIWNFLVRAVTRGWMYESGRTKTGYWHAAFNLTNWTFGFFWMRIAGRNGDPLLIGVDLGPFEISWSAP